MKLTWQGTLTVTTSKGEEKSAFTWKALTFEQAEALADTWLEQYLAVRGNRSVAIAATGQGAKPTAQMSASLVKVRFK